jgi:hypothetical protein
MRPVLGQTLRPDQDLIPGSGLCSISWAYFVLSRRENYIPETIIIKAKKEVLGKS